MRDAIRGHQLLEERLPMRDAIRGDQRTRGAPSNEGRNQRRSAHLLEERLQIIGEDSECHTQSEAIKGNQRTCSRSASK